MILKFHFKKFKLNWSRNSTNRRRVICLAATPHCCVRGMGREGVVSGVRTFLRETASTYVLLCTFIQANVTGSSAYHFSLGKSFFCVLGNYVKRFINDCLLFVFSLLCQITLQTDLRLLLCGYIPTVFYSLGSFTTLIAYSLSHECGMITG